MWLKIVCVILAFGWASTFVWYHEADLRQQRNKTIDDLRWKAQLDAFALHANSINQLTDIVVELAKRSVKE